MSLQIAVTRADESVILTPIIEIPIDTALTSTTLVAAAPGVQIVVIQAFLIVASAVNVTFKDGTTEKTGALPLDASGGLVLPPSFGPQGALGWFQTSVGNALMLATNSAVQVSGSLSYIALTEE